MRHQPVLWEYRLTVPSNTTQPSQHKNSVVVAYQKLSLQINLFKTKSSDSAFGFLGQSTQQTYKLYINTQIVSVQNRRHSLKQTTTKDRAKDTTTLSYR